MSSEPASSHATQLRNHWYWRPGWNASRTFYTWHITFEDQDQLHDLVSAYQAALRHVPGLDLIPIRWLHLTTQGVGFTDEIQPEQARAIATAVSQRLHELPPARLTFHRPVIRTEALALAPEPTQVLVTIRNAIRDGIAGVLGEAGVPEPGDQFEPHLSLAYVNTDGSANSAHQALSSVSPEPVQVTARSASLIVLRRDEHLYRWDTFAIAPFRGSS